MSVMQDSGNKYLLEQLSRLQEQAFGALAATLIVVAYVVYFVQDKVSTGSLYTWVALVLAINLYLLVWIVLARRLGLNEKNCTSFVNSYQFEAVIHGLAWGYLPFVLAQSQDVNTHLFSYYVICGMAAGAIATTGMIYRIYLSYMLPMMLPVVVYQMFISEFEIFSGSTVGLLVIFIVAMLMLAYRHNESVMKSIIFSMKNDELVKKLRKEYLRAEEASRAKSLFLANMSHELRTPLNAVIGYSEIIEEEANDSDSKTIADDAEKIRVSGKRLLKMIDDVLSLSRLEVGKIVVARKAFDLPSMIERIRPTLNEYCDINNNSLSIVISPEVHGIYTDERLLEKIIVNLISNAGKFTSQGAVKISIYQQSGTEHDICICVEDTGIGMDEDQLGILFDSFRQADESSTRKYDGMGLGMSISKKFIDLLGGTIAVHSIRDQGTRIEVCLPQDAQQHMA